MVKLSEIFETTGYALIKYRVCNVVQSKFADNIYEFASIIDLLRNKYDCEWILVTYYVKGNGEMDIKNKLIFSKEDDIDEEIDENMKKLVFEAKLTGQYKDISEVLIGKHSY